MAVLMWNQRWANALLPQTLQSPPGKLAHTAPRALHLSWGGAGCEKESVRRCACVLGVGLARGGGGCAFECQPSFSAPAAGRAHAQPSLQDLQCHRAPFRPAPKLHTPRFKAIPALSQSRSLLEVNQVRNDAIGVTLTRTGQVRPGPDAQT